MVTAESLPDPPASTLYGEDEYWENRYREEGKFQTFDWYQRYPALANIFDKYIPKRKTILMVGCGNSVLSADMVKDGYNDICNIDISPFVVESMAEKYKRTKELKWQTMDVRAMRFEDNTFDAVIDKGTLDSLMCGDDAATNAKKMLTEMSRVLRPGGLYMMITYGDPRLRKPHLQREQYKWDVKIHVMPRPDETRLSEQRVKELVEEPVEVDESGNMGPDLHWDNGDIHYVYVCVKAEEELLG